MDEHNVNYMTKTMSDYDLLKIRCDERQAMIERLRGALITLIADCKRAGDYGVDGIDIEIAEQALREVTLC
jgi:hypothetical protein